MTWLLVLTLTLPNGDLAERPVGDMFDREACLFAGSAMAQDLIELGLALAVTVDCIPGAEA